jgi:hypothetical protein
MTNHKITSQPWQLKAAAEGMLGAIILPLLGQKSSTQYPSANNFVIETTHGCYTDSGWCFCSSKNTFDEALKYIENHSGMRICTNDGTVLYDPNLYQNGDRIYLAEEWVKSPWGNDEGKISSYIYFTKSTTPEAEHMGWQPAETMPEEAAQYWFEVGDVRVVQMSDIDLKEIREAGLFNPLVDDLFSLSSTVETRWNAAHPDYLWDADRCVIVLKVLQSNGDDVPFPRLFDSVEY